jgi:hypothetical protein
MRKALRYCCWVAMYWLARHECQLTRVRTWDILLDRHKRLGFVNDVLQGYAMRVTGQPVSVGNWDMLVSWH